MKTAVLAPIPSASITIAITVKRRLHDDAYFNTERLKTGLAAAPCNDPPPRDILIELGRGWGEGGYRAVGGYLEEVGYSAAETEEPVLEIGSGLTTLLLGPYSVDVTFRCGL